jgi:hypothetical protein
MPVPLDVKLSCVGSQKRNATVPFKLYSPPHMLMAAFLVRLSI